MVMADRRLGSRLRVCELRALWPPRVPVRPELLRPVTPALPAARTRCSVHLLCGVTVFPAPWTLTQPKFTGLPQVQQRPANRSFTIANRAKNHPPKLDRLTTSRQFISSLAVRLHG